MATPSPKGDPRDDRREQEIKRWKATVKKYKEKAEKAEKEVEAAKKQINELTVQNGQQDAEINRLNREIEGMRNTYEAQISQLQQQATCSYNLFIPEQARHFSKIPLSSLPPSNYTRQPLAQNASHGYQATDLQQGFSPQPSPTSNCYSTHYPTPSSSKAYNTVSSQQSSNSSSNGSIASGSDLPPPKYDQCHLMEMFRRHQHQQDVAEGRGEGQREPPAPVSGKDTHTGQEEGSAQHRHERVMCRQSTWSTVEPTDLPPPQFTEQQIKKMYQLSPPTQLPPSQVPPTRPSPSQPSPQGSHWLQVPHQCQSDRHPLSDQHKQFKEIDYERRQHILVAEQALQEAEVLKREADRRNLHRQQKQLRSQQYEVTPQQQRYGPHPHVPPEAAHRKDLDHVLGTISERSDIGNNVQSFSQCESQAPEDRVSEIEVIDQDIQLYAEDVRRKTRPPDISVVDIDENPSLPYDPNLVCPKCGKRFHIGEIQKFKRHALETCPYRDRDDNEDTRSSHGNAPLRPRRLGMATFNSTTKGTDGDSSSHRPLNPRPVYQECGQQFQKGDDLQVHLEVCPARKVVEATENLTVSTSEAREWAYNNAVTSHGDTVTSHSDAVTSHGDTVHFSATKVFEETQPPDLSLVDIDEHPSLPYDPNLVCPKCGKRYHDGEIQKFRRHVLETCPYRDPTEC